MGDREAYPAGFAGSFADPARLTLPGAPPLGAARLDRIGVAANRDRTDGQVLFADQPWTKATTERVGKLDTPFGCHQPRGPGDLSHARAQKSPSAAAVAHPP